MITTNKQKTKVSSIKTKGRGSILPNINVIKHYFLAFISFVLFLASTNAYAVFTGSGVMSGDIRPGGVVSVTWTLTESDDNLVAFDVFSPSGADITDPAFGTTFASNVKPPIPAGSGLTIPMGPGPLTVTYTETNITLPATLAAGNYVYTRDWGGPSGNIVPPAVANFTIAGGGGGAGTITNITVSPSNVDANNEDDLKLRLTWTITTSGAATVTSSLGKLTPSNRLFGGAISGSTTGTRITIKETFTIPAANLSLGNLSFTREFDDGTTQKSASVSISVKKVPKILNITASNPATTVIQGKDAHFSITWRITTETGSRFANPSISSSSASLTSGNAKSKSKSIRGTGSAGLVTIVENVTLTAAEIQDAINNGAFNRLIYSRTFKSGKHSQKNISVNIPLKVVSPGSTGKLINSNLRLSYDDGSTSFKTIEQNKKLTARVEITTTGSGRLSGVWEWARGSTQRFIPYPNGRVESVISGSRSRTLTSPPLKTQQAGTYFIRFNMTSPTTSVIPDLRYQVIPNANPVKIILKAPASPIGANPKTYFSWQSQPKAEKTSLQIFAKNGSQCRPQNNAKPLTGKTLKTGNGNIKLSPIMARKLKAGQQYCWQVQAYEKGRQVAISDSRMFIWQGKISTSKTIIIPELGFEGVGDQTKTITIPELGFEGVGDQTKTITIPELGFEGVGDQTKTITIPELGFEGINNKTKPVTMSLLKLKGKELKNRTITIPRLRIGNSSHNIKTVIMPNLNI